MRMLERTSLLAQFAFTKVKQNTTGVTMILNNNAIPSIYFYNVSLVLYFCRKYVPHEKDFFFHNYVFFSGRQISCAYEQKITIQFLIHTIQLMRMKHAADI